MKDAEKQALKYNEIFGKGNFYLELQHHENLPEQKIINEGLLEISKKTSIPLVATNDIHYLRTDDAEAQDVLMLINTGASPNDPERLTLKGGDFSMKSPEQMIKEFKDFPEAIKNTQEIVEKCNFEFELNKIKLPKFQVPKNTTENDYLAQLCQEGIIKRYGKQYDKSVTERLDRELSVIKETGFASYFLIVQDFVNWAKENHIVVGPGRGSVGGSLVAYLLNITNVDPLKYNLLFERFLNPQRISLPDIDLDFTDRRRDEVIEYVANKYGRDKVAQIITFGTMAARAVVRDVGRALNYPYDYCDKIAKMIPFGSTLDQTLAGVEEFRQAYLTDEKAQKLIDFAKKLEGVARHASTHACGVVISEQPLDEIVPLQHPTQDENIIVTQYEMHAVEDLGLLKMDFLGLKNLTIIEDTLAKIYKIYDKKINIESLPLDDEKTYKLLQEGNSTGIFQMESDGFKRYLKQLKPTQLEDMIAMVALYRPGPMELIPEYIDRKHGKKKVEYLHPLLEPILKNTYGIMIYQEQLIQMVQAIAGFTLAEADILRKAVGKKIKKLLQEQRNKFFQGATKNKIPERITEQLWHLIEPFDRYGFNRSHAAAYAMIAYQTAWLKANFPVEFMSSLLTSERADTERIGFLIKECNKMSIEVLPPDINESFRHFSVVPQKNKIRFGLLAIKNVGENIAETVVEERKRNGRYESIDDFINRITSKDLNKKSLENLIKAGAFDAMEERNKLLFNMEKLLELNKENHKNNNGQKGLFDGISINHKVKLENAPPATKNELIFWEKDLLGLFVSHNPLEGLKNILSKKTVQIAEILNPVATKKPGGFFWEDSIMNRIRIGGIISKIKKITTKTGKPMIFMNVEDLSDKIEVVVFPSVIENNPEALQENKIVLVSGRMDSRNNSPKLICESVEEIIEN